ncbi:MAG: helix-turn-helix domain-containing protein [Candidatus Binatia bacterium]
MLLSFLHLGGPCRAPDRRRLWPRPTNEFPLQIGDLRARPEIHSLDAESHVVIAATHPASLQELAARTGRKASNLSRTLKTMEQYGLVRLHRGERGRVRPEVPYQSIFLELPLNA